MTLLIFSRLCLSLCKYLESSLWRIITSSYSKAIQNLLEAVIDITQVVFHDKIFSDLQDLVNETLYTTVLAALRLGAIVLIKL
jgi:hypothetical protein